MNYSEMSDAEINICVAQLLFPNKKVIASASRPPKAHIVGDGLKSGLWVDYCNSWADAGPIIEANKIAMIPESDGTWFALGNPQIKINWRVESTGAFHNDTTPLRAAMIVFLMMQEKPNA